jgi:hypothetical protein
MWHIGAEACFFEVRVFAPENRVVISVVFRAYLLQPSLRRMTTAALFFILHSSSPQPRHSSCHSATQRMLLFLLLFIPMAPAAIAFQIHTFFRKCTL